MNFFRKDGYNVVAVSNKCDGILSSINYIHVFLISPLNLIDKIYNLDLILLGIDLSIENSDIDISIFIIDTNINSESSPEHSNDDIFLL
ncbi:hypothetical protein EHE19_001995 [Ruminiclostridium herbifermentans]|uniref:Uncharacterized protein n=1 Tax=Ruminiclostridium herbifermentans TaxID=2488810 RepID=A0A4U7JGW0_9FIRM|nr:hypothetical protein [Ruminiclostridium herbifermentans]QNU67337.1 hypothetical protein EHE19_001995 [Ruminiclostridium herbifermentans]